MALKRFIEEIRTRQFDFIKKLSQYEGEQGDELFISYINRKVRAYNEQLTKLKEKLLQKDPPLSKTATIIEIHRFNAEQQNELINLLIQLSKAIAKEKANSVFQQELITLREELRAILKTARQFNKWSSTIITLSSLEGKESPISRFTTQATTYNKSSENEHTAESDKKLAISGEGIPLPPRLMPEALDPKHRAWGTLYIYISHFLQPIFNKWVESEKSEDLTVELEFDDGLRALDEAFDPDTFVKPQEGEDRQWYNSMNFYCSKRESLDYLLTTNKNRLSKGFLSCPMDTNEKRFIFVMDMQGNLFINENDAYRKGRRIGHPSFTGGQPVACAGEMIIAEGKVTYINNQSGHYQPGGYTLYRVISELKTRNVLASSCEVEVISDDDFLPEKKQYQRNNKLSLEQYEQKYQELMGEEEATKLDLSEKPNPKALLSCLEKFNHYLMTRSGETNRVLTTLFNSYNGSDYYERNKSFAELIILMKSKDIGKIIAKIDEKLPEFSRGHRKNYANLLIELGKILTTSENILADKLVQETLDANLSMNEVLRKHAGVHLKYQTRVSSRDGSIERGKIAATKTYYEFFRKSINPELRSQFSKAEVLEKEQEHNTKFYKSALF